MDQFYDYRIVDNHLIVNLLMLKKGECKIQLWCKRSCLLMIIYSVPEKLFYYFS
jgi:hypothetical protein